MNICGHQGKEFAAILETGYITTFCMYCLAGTIYADHLQKNGVPRAVAIEAGLNLKALLMSEVNKEDLDQLQDKIKKAKSAKDLFKEPSNED